MIYAIIGLVLIVSVLGLRLLGSWIFRINEVIYELQELKKIGNELKDRMDEGRPKEA